MVIGRRRQVEGQIAGSRIDGCLNVPGRAIGGAVEVELNGDGCATERADRSDLGDSGNLTQAALEGRGNGGCDRCRVGSRKRRLNADHGKVNTRDRRHRQESVGYNSDQKQSRGQQRSAGWTVDEWGGNVQSEGRLTELIN